MMLGIPMILRAMRGSNFGDGTILVADVKFVPLITRASPRSVVKGWAPDGDSDCSPE